MTQGTWLALIGTFATVAHQCEKRLDDRDIQGAVRAYFDLEAALERLKRLSPGARPRCHKQLADDLHATILQLASRIRRLRGELPAPN